MSIFLSIARFIVKNLNDRVFWLLNFRKLLI